MPEFTLQEFIVMIFAIVAFIILIILVFRLQSAAGLSFWYAGCEGDIGGTLVPGHGYANPRCDWIANSTSCKFMTYKNITRANNENLSVCVWFDTAENVGGKNVSCFLNTELNCEDFSQTTVPRCQDVPDCKAVSIVKVAITRLKPT